MNQKKEAEIWMDKLAKIEADKQWERTQQTWMKEESARIDLLKQVYKERENAVNFKSKIKNIINYYLGYVKDQERDQLKMERDALDEEIRKYQEKLEKIKQEEAIRRKSHQDDLKYQMSEKERQRLKEMQDKAYDERAAQLWEREYQKKINEQRELHMKRVINIL
jgi:hypothetical protein